MSFRSSHLILQPSVALLSFQNVPSQRRNITCPKTLPSLTQKSLYTSKKYNYANAFRWIRIQHLSGTLSTTTIHFVHPKIISAFLDRVQSNRHVFLCCLHKTHRLKYPPENKRSDVTISISCLQLLKTCKVLSL